jgi:hypothetical protein
VKHTLESWTVQQFVVQRRLRRSANWRGIPTMCMGSRRLWRSGSIPIKRRSRQKRSLRAAPRGILNYMGI